MDTESKSLLRKVIIDVVCLAVVGFSVLYFYLFGVPYHRGFFCDDQSIRMPFKGSTVTSAMLYFVGLVLPICIISAVEWMLAQRRNERQATRSFMGRPIHPWLWRCYCTIGAFGFGAASSQLLTDIGKYTIGRLRPHFWAVCLPNVNCTLPENQGRYIEDFECQGTNAHLVKETRVSFPSGHSSFSAYTMIFLALYVQCRVNWPGSHLLRHIVQFICISLAWFTALSRVSDYKHHWSDVLAGSLLGTLVAIIVVRYVSILGRDAGPDYNPAVTSEASQNNGVNLTVTANA